MVHLILQRLKETDKGTFGVIIDPALCGKCTDQMNTLELPWFNNARSKSCIPAGVYSCVPRRSIKYPYKHYILQNVEDRSYILIHRGNTIKDTRGCILVGTSVTSKGVWNSKVALTQLVNRYPAGFTLTVKDKANGC